MESLIQESPRVDEDQQLPFQTDQKTIRDSYNSVRSDLTLKNGKLWVLIDKLKTAKEEEMERKKKMEGLTNRQNFV